MTEKQDFNTQYQRIAYVKSVSVADLPSEVQDAAGDAKELFAVHNADGEQLALVADRSLAFVLARQNQMQPLTVH